MKKILIIIITSIFCLACKKNRVKITVPLVITTAITDTTGTTAKSGGSISSDGGGAITSKGVVWSTNPSPTILLPTITNQGPGNTTFSSSISGLSPNTIYYLRAYATNQSGTGYGNQLTFKTKNINLSQGLVAYYPFTGNANDASGNNKNGTIIDNVTPTTDRFGVANSAYLFAASTNAFNTNRINLPELSTQIGQPGTSYSVSAWFNGVPDTWGGSNKTGQIIHCSDNREDYSISRLEVVNFGSGPLKKIYHRMPSQNIEPVSSTGYSTSAWHNITIVVNATNGDYKYYFDGVLDPSMSFTFNPLNNYYVSGRIWQIGALQPTIGPNVPHQFVGKIDDIRIYNRVLTNEEIIFLYNN